MPTPLAHPKNPNYNNLYLNPNTTERPTGKTHPKNPNHNNLYLNPNTTERPIGKTHPKTQTITTYTSTPTPPKDP